ncbi:MAG TPA: hypothetical protein PLY00_03230 [Verrucomicrobiota bacterium]|nr:hypothetical protein [Verrucomicrobiota bacterium]
MGFTTKAGRAGPIHQVERRRLKNLPVLRQISFAANRRVLQVEQLTHDCHIGAEAFDQLQKPAQVDGQHVSALPIGQERVQALFTVLVF